MSWWDSLSTPTRVAAAALAAAAVAGAVVGTSSSGPGAIPNAEVPRQCLLAFQTSARAHTDQRAAGSFDDCHPTASTVETTPATVAAAGETPVTAAGAPLLGTMAGQLHTRGDPTLDTDFFAIAPSGLTCKQWANPAPGGGIESFIVMIPKGSDPLYSGDIGLGIDATAVGHGARRNNLSVNFYRHAQGADRTQIISLFDEHGDITLEPDGSGSFTTSTKNLYSPTGANIDISATWTCHDLPLNTDDYEQA